MPASPDVSIIIPSRNNMIEKCSSLFYTVRSVIAQTRVTTEIIIVDDNGTDLTMRRLAEAFPQVIVVHSTGGVNNLGKLRNLGASSASAESLLFLDDDTVLPDREMLQRTCRVLETADFCCGASRLWTSIYWYRHVVGEQSISSAIRTLLSLSIEPRGINRENGFRDLNEFTFLGNYGAIRADLFSQIGGYDEAFPGWGFEDTDLMMRLCLREATYEILAERGEKVIHLNHVASLRDDYLRNMKRFNDLELERGLYFHVNHFFNVYEADGHALFTPITP